MDSGSKIAGAAVSLIKGDRGGSIIRRKNGSSLFHSVTILTRFQFPIATPVFAWFTIYDGC